MILDGVLFLAARTTRSQAYAQAMVHAGMSPSSVLVYGAEKSGRLGQANRSIRSGQALGYFVPDLSEPLEDTLEKLGAHTRFIDEGSVASGAVAEHLADIAPRMVVYSGYGSEIVPGSLCGSYRFLHMHAGWLPEYRGSTTIYYSLLRENSCGVSAIFLAPSIDAGPILMRRRYPAPPNDMDIDHIYDGMLRADLLIRVLEKFVRDGLHGEGMPQDVDDGETYFIIHPVLKNIVIERVRGLHM